MLFVGCSDYFNLADRRHWAATLARCVGDNTRTLQPMCENWGGTISHNADKDEEKDKEDVPPPTPALGELPSGTGAWALAEGGADGTWREALLELR